ncbi:hypothetical protein [Nocardioides antri]|uniref:Uncharacterized protein n=1 Tax=Nocardioides antri TaxID=2607659 RepID=A0A5B1MCX2_9ACTN|nr:hypothetical protein [Nocardioides antri]KAA1429430.1 hypothetical protein F0U47_04395 [Nocardioides antri]
MARERAHRRLFMLALCGVFFVMALSAGFRDLSGSDRLLYAMLMVPLSVVAFGGPYFWFRAAVRRGESRATFASSRAVPTWGRVLIGLGAMSGVFVASALDGANGGIVAVPCAAAMGFLYAAYRFVPDQT